MVAGDGGLPDGNEDDDDDGTEATGNTKRRQRYEGGKLGRTRSAAVFVLGLFGSLRVKTGRCTDSDKLSPAEHVTMKIARELPQWEGQLESIASLDPRITSAWHPPDLSTGLQKVLVCGSPQ